MIIASDKESLHARQDLATLLCLKQQGLKEDISEANEQFVVVWKTQGNPLPIITFSKWWFNLGQLNTGPVASITQLISNRATHHQNVEA